MVNVSRSTPAKRCRALQELGARINEGLQYAEIAAVCGVNKSTVSRWFSLERAPSEANKAEMKKHYAIALSWWSQPELLAAAAAPPKENVEHVEELTIRQRAQRYQKIVDEAMRDLNGEGVSPARKLANVRDASRALASLGKITGETRDITEAQIVKMPAWSRVCTKILTALTPWPEAVLAFGHALRELDLEDR